MGLFTWNIRTGYIDTLANYTGLEIARWVLVPGKWATQNVTEFLTRYVYLVGLREENESLRGELDKANSELLGLREDAAQAKRLRELLNVPAPLEWEKVSARVIAHRLGPNAALETMIIDKGAGSGLKVNTPVICPLGVVGRTLRVSQNAATIILINDPNSRIPVIGQKNRSRGILAGQGPGEELELQYVQLGAAMEEGELLVTSGLGEILPEGLPVAVVSRVGQSGPTLFQNIYARPLFDPRGLEEVVALRKPPAPEPIREVTEELPAKSKAKKAEEKKTEKQKAAEDKKKPAEASGDEQKPKPGEEKKPKPGEQSTEQKPEEPIKKKRKQVENPGEQTSGSRKKPAAGEQAPAQGEPR